MATEEPPKRSCDLVEFDWLMSYEADLLHVADGLGEDGDTLWENVRFVCGQHVESAWIPGFSSRLSARRCAGCCDIRGYPRGKGSPKNDDACRLILGLPLDPEENQQ